MSLIIIHPNKLHDSIKDYQLVLLVILSKCHNRLDQVKPNKCQDIFNIKTIFYCTNVMAEERIDDSVARFWLEITKYSPRN